MNNLSRLHMSLSDIARLAQVQRPVVSMWRRRPLAGHPFPAPVAQVGGEERFDAQEVAAYLAATGRGNNAEATDDLAAHTKLDAVSALDEGVCVDGITALLCLTVCTGGSLGDLSVDELLTAAREVDPDDSFLVRETEALGSDLAALARHADELASASYSAKAAFERVLRRHAASVLPGHAAMTLTPAAQALVARTAAALAANGGMETPLVVDVTDSTADLLLVTISLYAGDSPPSVATLASDSRTARLARRRLRVHDVHRLDVRVDAVGDFVVPGHEADEGAVHVLQLPPVGSPALSDLDVLDAVGNLIIQLADHSRVVVIGPASALTDRPVTSELDLARDAALRSDRLRAVVRLPRGLLVRAPRQSLALWALGPAHPAVAVRDRWTVVADLSEDRLTDSVIDGVVTDVVAAMTPNDRSVTTGGATPGLADDAHQVRGHRFTYGRRVLTSSLLSSRRSLVEREVRKGSADADAPRGAELAATIDRLVAQVDSPSLRTLRAEVAQDVSVEARVTTVDQAIVDGWLRAFPGNRLDQSDLGGGGEGRSVIGLTEVLREAAIGDRTIDLMVLAARYPAGRLTEPGDVVLCAGSRIGAVVDTEGGSVVQRPARVLRVTEAGCRHLVPSVLAHDLASGPVDVHWRRLHIRSITGSHDHFVATVEAIERERSTLVSRLALLDELTTAITDGATSGVVTLTHSMPESPQTIPVTAQKEGR